MADRRPSLGNRVKTVAAFVCMGLGIFSLVVAVYFPFGVADYAAEEAKQQQDRGVETDADRAAAKDAFEIRALTGDYLGGTVSSVANVAATLLVLAALLLQSVELNEQRIEFIRTQEIHNEHKDAVEEQNTLSRFFSIMENLDEKRSRIPAKWPDILNKAASHMKNAKNQDSILRSDSGRWSNFKKNSRDTFDALMQLAANASTIEQLSRLADSIVSESHLDGETKERLGLIISLNGGADVVAQIGKITEMASNMADTYLSIDSSHAPESF